MQGDLQDEISLISPKNSCLYSKIRSYSRLRTDGPMDWSVAAKSLINPNALTPKLGQVVGSILGLGTAKMWM